MSCSFVISSYLYFCFARFLLCESLMLNGPPFLRYLPPKSEYVVLCQPSETQLSLYSDVVGCRSLRKCFTSVDPGDHLSAILALRKLCNHPALLAIPDGENEKQSDLAQEIAGLLPSHLKAGVYDEAVSICNQQRNLSFPKGLCTSLVICNNSFPTKIESQFKSH